MCFFNTKNILFFFNENATQKVHETEYSQDMQIIEAEYSKVYNEKKEALQTIVQNYKTDQTIELKYSYTNRSTKRDRSHRH